jgi:recombination DNA repair RAD52 pathway protein
MAVKFAIRLKNTEPAVRKTGAYKTTTESRGSVRGEQKHEESAAAAPGTGPAGAMEATDDHLEPTGDKEMKKENSGEMPLAAVVQESHSANTQNNILNFSSTLRELRKTLDPQLVKRREGWTDRNGNPHMVDYIEWHTVADILDQTAANWEHMVKDIRQIGSIVTVTVAITIDGVTREGIGTGPAESEMGIKKAEHDALKRAAVKFGIARDLYKREFDEAAVPAVQPAAQAEPEGFPANPLARSLSDMITAKQLGMIRAIAREIGIDADQECKTVMLCKTDELSKRAASSLITHLQEMQKTRAAPIAMPFPQAA